MIRPLWKIAQATSLMGLVACLVSCAGDSSRSDFAATDRFEPPREVAGWVDSPPEGCSVGSSGPTLNPRNAVRYARLSAIEALASGSLEVDVQSVTGSGSHGEFEMTSQSLSGTLADARVVALFAETNPGMQGRRRLRQMHALACWPDADLSDVPEPDYPRWLIEPPNDGSRICATGIAGPTWKAADQPESALSDGRLALAVALESRIEKRIFDDGRGVARMARQVEPSAAALSRAATAVELEELWLDEKGTGPIGLPGVLYGLVCIED